jgi:hypothetical protein
MRVFASVVRFVMGAAAGGLLGLVLTLAIVVAMARLGHYVFALDELATVRWETVGVPIGTVFGAWIAVRAPVSFGLATRDAAGGLLLGALVCALMAAMMGTSPEGRWSAGIIGAAAVAWMATIRRLVVGTRRSRGPEHGDEQRDDDQ